VKATFLEAEVPLTKTFTMEDGQIKKIGHPRILNYTSHEVEYSNIEELLELLKRHAAKGHCFLKGLISRPLRDEPRAGTTDPNAPTSILLLDFDGIRGIDDIAIALAQLKIAGVDYVVQYSSSMGVLPERGLSAHVFILLDRPYSPALLKQWLTHQNLTVPVLKQNLSLTRTTNAIRWALDITTCQNDKLIYIAPPLLRDGVQDNFQGERIQLVKGTQRVLALPGVIPNAEANKQETEKTLNDLRTQAGLPRRPKTQYKNAGSVEYLANPDKAVVTGVRSERGFTYLNINGGDSWAYYHPENNPEIIFNFKNEPNYRTSELLPEYWSEVRERLNAPRVGADGTMYLAFRDFRTSQYYNGTWDPKAKRLEMAVAKSKDQIKDFLKQHGQITGDFIPDWRVTFNPQVDFIVDEATRTVNTFQPSAFMRMKPIPGKKVPPIIRRVILHALGNDEEAYEHYLNWVAVIYQFRIKVGTSWVEHGIQGTGKGLIVNEILKPLFGNDYVLITRMSEFDSQFNGFLEKALIVHVDEAKVSDFKQAGVIDANFKNYIVEPRMTIRRMHTMPYEVESYANFVFASNKHDPVIIDPTDRRYNVAGYQPSRLEITQAEIDQMRLEVTDFAHYMATYPADKDRARKALNNAAKQQMMHIGRASIDEASDAFRTGDLEYFMDQRPTDGTESLPPFERQNAERYIALVQRMIDDEPQALSREEIYGLLRYIVGDSVPSAPVKFTSYLKHHDIHIKPVAVKGKTVRGINVKWQVKPEWKGRK
jgi:hypothetical protein